jgi:hypothetical protein
MHKTNFHKLLYYPKYVKKPYSNIEHTEKLIYQIVQKTVQNARFYFVIKKIRFF